MTRHFNINDQGRDYVVGDIHGCFALLARTLKSLGFDPERDRCFAVGDMVNRGPSSGQLLNWLKQPWFFACRGNHEEMLISLDANTPEGYDWFNQNGGQWWLALDDAERQPYIEALSELPLTIEIETHGGRVGLVHADIPEGISWHEFIHYLEQGDAESRRAALWSRKRASGQVKSSVQGIDLVVCGHTITRSREVEHVGNVALIDTGAFLNDGCSKLSVIPLDSLLPTI